MPPAATNPAAAEVPALTNPSGMCTLPPCEDLSRVLVDIDCSCNRLRLRLSPVYRRSPTNVKRRSHPGVGQKAGTSR